MAFHKGQVCVMLLCEILKHQRPGRARTLASCAVSGIFFIVLFVRRSPYCHLILYRLFLAKFSPYLKQQQHRELANCQRSFVSLILVANRTRKGLIQLAENHTFFQRWPFGVAQRSAHPLLHDRAGQLRVPGHEGFPKTSRPHYGHRGAEMVERGFVDAVLLGFHWDAIWVSPKCRVPHLHRTMHEGVRADSHATPCSRSLTPSLEPSHAALHSCTLR
mmetsp:Transcript_22771/g.40364  ORF Transcript_22771/g.40364 Transcript_22771/m.40364 type:complete len:218 (-) Transcript_22771:38-691(-)